MATACLFITECYRLDTANKVRKGGIHEQISEGIAMCRCHELHTTFCNCASCSGLQLGANLVNDDHLRHVIFDCLDHHGMLLRCPCDLHPTCTTDTRVWDIAITCDFVGGIYHHHALICLIG